MSKTDRMRRDDAPTGTPILLASTASAQMIAIPAEMRGKFVRFALVAGGTKSAIRFGTEDTVTVDDAASSVDGPTGVVTPAGTEPHLVLAQDGPQERVRLDAAWTHLAHQEDATGGFWSMVLATGDGD